MARPMMMAVVGAVAAAGLVAVAAAAVVAVDPPRGAGGEIEEILRAHRQAVSLINQATSQRLAAAAGRLQESGERDRALEVYKAAYRLDRENRAAAGALVRAGVKLDEIKPDEPVPGIAPAVGERAKRPEEKLPRGEGEGGADRPRGEVKERRPDGAREEGGEGEGGRRAEKPRVTDGELNRLLGPETDEERKEREARQERLLREGEKERPREHKE